MNERIKFAVLGCGHIGKRHAEIVASIPDASLAALIDINTALQPSLESEFPGVPFFTNLDHFIRSGTPADVINIATPNGFHAVHAIHSLENNMHVVIEKPMGLSTVSCEEIIKTAMIKGRHVFCVMQNRYSPPAEWLRSILKKELLGRIFIVNINCLWNRDERYYKGDGWHGRQDLDGGTLFTQFSHFIDLMYWMFGDVKNILARFADFNHRETTEFEDSGFISFDFVKGGVGTFNYSTSTWDTNMESSMTIIGENGAVKIGGQYMDRVEYCHIKNYEMPELRSTNPPNEYGQYKGSAANHQYIIKNVIDVLNGKAGITTSAIEGLKVVDIIERIYALR